uniref:LysM domain-containing protein n=2 Tax=Physcomitrium patens TaxID=3218 RepID=A0A7I4FBL6_PHYPA
MIKTLCCAEEDIQRFHCHCTSISSAQAVLVHQKAFSSLHSRVISVVSVLHNSRIQEASARMAATGARPSGGKKRGNDENIAKAAGAVVAGGIAWSLFRSITGRRNQQDVDVASSNDVEQKVGDTQAAIRSKTPHFGHKSAGKTVQVRDGDTLWGIARKYNVSVDALMASNGISDGDSIVVGEMIVLPKALKP